MPYIFYFIICLFLIIVQSTAIPFLPESIKCFDLLIVFVLYVGLFKEFLSTFIVVFILGLIMDLLSGGGFGLYISAYFWMLRSGSILTAYKPLVKYLECDWRVPAQSSLPDESLQ